MPTETLLPDAILEQSGWSATPAVTSIDEDPDSHAGDWIVAASNTADPIVRVSFPTPTGSPTDGTQTFKVYVRKGPPGSIGSGTPTARIDLYENGSLLISGADQSVTGTGQVLSQSFTGVGTALTTKDGSAVEARLVVVHAAGGPSARCSVDLDAIDWDVADYSSASSWTETPADTVSLADSRALSVGKALADTASIADEQVAALTMDRRTDAAVAISDSFSRTLAALRSVDDGVSIADAISRAITKVIADTVTLSDAASPALGAGGQSHTLTPSDSVEISDAIALSLGLALSDGASVSDAFAKTAAYTRQVADPVSLADSSAPSREIAREIVDSASISDSFARLLQALRSIDDAVTLADNAQPVLTPPGGQAHSVEINDSVLVADAVTTGRAIVRTLADTVAVGDSFARLCEAHRLFADSLSIADSLSTSATGPITPGRLGGGNASRIAAHGVGSSGARGADTRRA